METLRAQAIRLFKVTSETDRKKKHTLALHKTNVYLMFSKYVHYLIQSTRCGSEKYVDKLYENIAIPIPF